MHVFEVLEPAKEREGPSHCCTACSWVSQRNILLQTAHALERLYCDIHGSLCASRDTQGNMQQQIVRSEHISKSPETIATAMAFGSKLKKACATCATLSICKFVIRACDLLDQHVNWMLSLRF